MPLLLLRLPWCAVIATSLCRSHKITVPLAAGDVLIMMGTTQQHWQHTVPKRKNVPGPRVNLTFRNIMLPEKQQPTAAVHSSSGSNCHGPKYYYTTDQ